MTNKKNEILLKLERTFDDLGINVKYDKLKGDGGYCKYKEKEYIILNKILPVKSRIDMLKNILSDIVEEKDVFIVPEIREMLEKENNENNK